MSTLQKVVTDLTQCDLDRLNSATKYPAIPTYHEIGARGQLQEATSVSFDKDEEVVVTEKIDGTNARIIMFPDGDYIIGSREELLYAKGDRIQNATLGIVEVVQPIADGLRDTGKGNTFLDLISSPLVEVYYGEVYGHGVGKHGKQYSSTKTCGFRVFDIAIFKLPELERLLQRERSEISSWRQHGGQKFLPEEVITVLDGVTQVTPRIETTMPPPQELAAAYDWLHAVLPDGTLAAIDAGAGGAAEGVVVRSKDRSKIVKLRFADYAKTLKAGGR